MPAEAKEFFGRRGLVVGVLMLMLFLLAACGGTATPETSTTFTEDADAITQPLPTLDAAMVTSGQQIYAQNCASCHGAQGEGQPNWKQQLEDGTYPAPPHTADGHTWHHGDGTLFQYIKVGGAGMNIPNFKSNMPAFEGTLTDEEIVAVISYLKSLWPEEQRRVQWDVSQRDPFPTP